MCPTPTPSRMNDPLPASLEQILLRLQAVLKALHLGVWLVLCEYVLLAISPPLELPLGITAAVATAAATAALLGRLGASRWEPRSQVQRATYTAIALEVFTLLGAGGFVLMQFRPAIPENAELRLLQVMALAQFVSGVMLVPFLARTTGRLGARRFRPLLAAVLYWAEGVILSALVCWGVSYFTEATFVTIFGYVGPILAAGFQLAQWNVLVGLMRLVQHGADAAATIVEATRRGEAGSATGGPRDEPRGASEQAPDDQPGGLRGRRGLDPGPGDDGAQGEDPACESAEDESAEGESAEDECAEDESAEDESAEDESGSPNHRRHPATDTPPQDEAGSTG